MLLQDATLVLFKSGLAGQTLVNNEKNPYSGSIDNQEVDEDRRDVAIPNGTEVGIEGQIINIHKAFEG